MDIDNLQLPISLNELRNILKRHKVASASVFGSYARGEARPESDLDLLVEMQPRANAFDVVDLQGELQRVTQRKVDVATKLHPRFEPYIAPELVPVL